MPTYYHRFAVTGRYPFPVDMLRYDGAFPRETTDAMKIQQAICPGTSKEIREVLTVSLVIVNDRRIWQPNFARWSSFGWSVDPESLVSEKVGP